MSGLLRIGNRHDGLLPALWSAGQQSQREWWPPSAGLEATHHCSFSTSSSMLLLTALLPKLALTLVRKLRPARKVCRWREVCCSLHRLSMN